MAAPALLVLGNVTCDELAGETRLGGAAGFAARAAALLEVRVALVTAAPPDHPLLAPLLQTPGLTTRVRPSATLTTFALDYSGPRRRLTLRDPGTRLRAGDLPRELAGAAAAYVAPVAGECDGELVRALGSRLIGVGLQGWLRRFGAGGAVEPCVGAEVEQLPEGIGAVIFSEEDHPDAELLAARLAERTVVALTRGARGATLYMSDRRHDVPAAAAREVDPTGAGDVFGVVFTLALAAGATPADAAAHAADAAARVVEGPGLGRLPEAELTRLRRLLASLR